MKAAIIEQFLCCPLDHAYPLRIEDARWEGDELLGGVLRCPRCATGYPVIGGIPHLLPPSAAQAAEVVAAKQREAQARDADSVVYDATVSPYQTRLELEALLRALHVRRSSVVLDLGAGTGRLTTQLAARHAVVFALDISPRSLEMNRAKCAKIPGATVHHVACDACYLPLRDGLLDTAGSGMLLEHIPTPEERRRCIEEVRRVLKPGGVFAFTVYNYSWTKRRMAEREGFHGKDLYYYRFDGAELHRMLGNYRNRNVTGLINMPVRLQVAALDQLVAAVPPVAQLTGDLLFAVARR